MYRILQEEGIDLPRYAVLNRDPDKPDGQEAIAAILSLQSVKSYVELKACRSLENDPRSKISDFVLVRIALVS